MTDWTNRIRGYKEIPANQLLANPANARRHPARQREALRGSLDALGWVAPVIVNVANGGYVLDGHARIEEALTRDEDTLIPVIEVELNQDEEALFLASYDWITQLAAYDREALSNLLHDTDDALERLGLEDDGRLQDLLGEMAAAHDLSWGDEEPPADPGPQIDRAAELQQVWGVEPGDLWILPSLTGDGQHRLLCGDSTKAEDVARVMGEGNINGVFTSPPYAEQRKKQYGGIPADEYLDWWLSVQMHAQSHLIEDGSFFLNIKPHCEDDSAERSLYVMDLVIAMKRLWGWLFIDEFCWLRAGVPKRVVRHFKNAFEPIYQFALSKDFKFRPEAVMHESDNVPVPFGEGAGDTNWARWQGHGKFKPGGNVANMQGHVGNIFAAQEIKPGMAYPSNVLKGIQQSDSYGHEATFPVGLPAFFIQAYSDIDNSWYDPFGGSGTTMVACEQLQRQCRMIEIEPKYCAVILQRLADMGLQPERLPAQTGQP